MMKVCRKHLLPADQARSDAVGVCPYIDSVRSTVFVQTGNWLSLNNCRVIEQYTNYPARASLSDSHDDAFKMGSSHVSSSFEDVFERLQRVESQVFSSGGRPSVATPTHRIDSNAERDEPESCTSAWQLTPSLLDPSNLDVIVGAAVFKILDKKNTTIRKIGDKFFGTLYQSLPVLSRETFDQPAQESERVGYNGDFFDSHIGNSASY